MEDSSQLDYQAGQEEEEGAGKDKKQPEPQKQQQKADSEADVDRDADKDGQGAEEEGGINEDVQDKYEDSHFAPPTAPEEVRAALAEFALQCAVCSLPHADRCLVIQYVTLCLKMTTAWRAVWTCAH